MLEGEQGRRLELVFDAERRELREVMGAELTGRAVAERVAARVLPARVPEVVGLVPPVITALAIDGHARALVGRGGLGQLLVACGDEA